MESLKVIVENNSYGQLAVKVVGWAAMRPRFQSKMLAMSTSTDDGGGAPDGRQKFFCFAAFYLWQPGGAASRSDSPVSVRS